MNFTVIGIDVDGRLICRADNGEVYNCGDAIKDFGIHNLSQSELNALVFFTEWCN